MMNVYKIQENEQRFAAFGSVLGPLKIADEGW